MSKKSIFPEIINFSANSFDSFKLIPFSKPSGESLTPIIKAFPHSALMPSMISNTNRKRFSEFPP